MWECVCSPCSWRYPLNFWIWRYGDPKPTELPSNKILFSWDKWSLWTLYYSREAKPQSLSDAQRQRLCSHSLLMLEPGERQHRNDFSTITAIKSSWAHNGDVFVLQLIKWDLALWSCWVFLFRNNIKITFDLHQRLKGFRCCHPE